MDTKKIVVILLIIAVVLSVFTIGINLFVNTASDGFRRSTDFGSQQIRSGSGGIILTIEPPSGSER